jgi:hypothetical protein
MAARLSALAREADVARATRAIFVNDGPIAGAWEPTQDDIESIAGMLSAEA